MFRSGHGRVQWNLDASLALGVCNTVNCGPSGVCIERALIQGLAYVCGCVNGTDSYISADPCPCKTRRRLA